jgi:hypothetical protein
VNGHGRRTNLDEFRRNACVIFCAQAHFQQRRWKVETSIQNGLVRADKFAKELMGEKTIDLIDGDARRRFNEKFVNGERKISAATFKT